MKTLNYFILFALAVVSSYAQIRPASHEWRATLKIVDDFGLPVSGAAVTIRFSGASPEGTPVSEKIEGLSDTNGVFTTTHSDKSVKLMFQAQKAGYYPVRIQHVLGFSTDENSTNWNSTPTLILKRIVNPIAMYARNARLEVPALSKAVGFDLIEYDWIAPYGRGKNSDLIFQAERRWKNRQDFDSVVRITFPNRLDGLVASPVRLDEGSDLRLPVLAPSEGYAAELSREFGHTPSDGWKKDSKKELNYYLRVRIVPDEMGNIKSALYGKIYGDITIDPINTETALVFFTYYLNPTPNSRNVEFDPKKNLFRSLSDREQVTAP